MDAARRPEYQGLVRIALRRQNAGVALFSSRHLQTARHLRAERPFGETVHRFWTGKPAALRGMARALRPTGR
jgi:hypothetical protein